MAKKRSTIVLGGLLAIGLSLLLLPTVFAQSSGNCGGQAGCVDSSDFDTAGTDGWLASFQNLSQTVDLAWVSSKSLGALWWSTSAQGVLQLTPNSNFSYDSNTGVDGIDGVRKTLFLQPGRYKVVFRAATASAGEHRTVLYASYGDYVPGSFVNVNRYNFSLSDSFREYSSTDQEGSGWYQGKIIVQTPELVTFILTADYPSAGYAEAPLFFDYVWVIRMSDSPVPTSTLAPGFPTSTPFPAQATSLPVGTAVCQDKPSPEPTGLPAYGVTPSPVPAAAWSLFQGWDGANLSDWKANWPTTGETFWPQMNSRMGHAALGSLQVPNSPDGDPVSPRPALIYSPTTTLPNPVYVNLWAQANDVPTGTTEHVEVFYQDTEGSWHTAVDAQISSGSWYPIHAEISSNVAALAFAAYRSDGADGAGVVYLDDLYFYGDPSVKPYCDGSYPPSTTYVGFYTKSPGVNDVNSFSSLSVPENKPCPPEILRPNNFFGYLLAGVTFFIDALFSTWPFHDPGQLRAAIQSLLLSPIGVFFPLLAVLLDWSFVFGLLKIAIALFGIYIVALLWKFLRRATIE